MEIVEVKWFLALKGVDLGGWIETCVDTVIPKKIKTAQNIHILRSRSSQSFMPISFFTTSAMRFT